MAKKEQKLSYGQLPLPSSQSTYTQVKYNWSGLNRRQTIDTGELSAEENISTAETPYLTPSPKWSGILKNTYEKAVAMFSYDDFIVVIYIKINKLYLDYIKLNDYGNPSNTFTGIISDAKDVLSERKIIRSMVQFNLYSSVNDVTDGVYIKRLILFPDKRSMYFNIITTDTDPGTLESVSGWDLNAMYCYFDESAGANKYYVWDNSEQKFVSKGTGAFELDQLDVDVKSFYNDGYEKTTDTVYNSEKTYYTRTIESGKYKYNAVSNLSSGSVVADYYEEMRYNDGYVETSDTTAKQGKTYYEKTGGAYKKATLAVGDTTKNYYEYITDYFPPDDSQNTSCYYKNTYNSDVYKYTDDGWRVSVNPSFPNLKYAVVHLSRLFGVDDDRVYVSGFNDYTNWNLDTSDTNSANAWCSAAQSNTKADGKFTGITVFDNHVVCFKHDYMHEIYNNKNPFRLVDVFAEGCIDNRTIQEVNGRLIFVSHNEVQVYTGGNPKNIGYNLGIDRFDEAVSGTDGRNYYLFCTSGQNSYLFVYDTWINEWSQQKLVNNSDVLYFAHNNNGMFMLCRDGQIYRIDEADYKQDWYFETDLSTAFTSSSSALRTVSIKHIKKIQLYVNIPQGSKLKIYALYDEEKFNANSHLLFDSAKDGRTGMIPIRIKPRMTANYGFKLRFAGNDYVKIHSMEIYKTQGGELYE